MSDGQELPDDFVDLAKEYIDVVVGGEGIEEKENIDQSIESLRSDLESIENDLEEYDDDHPLHPVLEKRYDEKKERLENINEEYEREEQIKEGFPKRVLSDFAATDDLLTEHTIKSVSHTLIGEAQDELHIGDIRLTPDSEMEPDTIIQVTKTIHQLMRCEIGKDNDIQELWDTLTERDQSIIGVLGSANDEIGPTGIANDLEEDLTKGAVSPRLGKDRDRTYSLFYDGDEGYELSLVGEYFHKTFHADRY